MATIATTGITATRFGAAAPVAATINLLSAVTDGPLTLVLTFDRPPAGAVLSAGSYTITTSGGGHVPSVASVALDAVPPGEVYPFGVRLAFAEQATDGESYAVAVAGITGPCDEALGVDSASWTAEAVAPQAVSAQASHLDLAVTFDADLDPATIGDPGDWTLAGMTSPPTILSVTLDVVASLVDLVLDGELATGATITAPATVTDTSGNAVDAAHRTATVYVDNDDPVSLDGTDANAAALYVTPSGEPHADPWSPLPDDPTDEDDILDRATVACLGTDRARSATDVMPPSNDAVPYSGGTWYDFYEDPAERLDSRGWMVRLAGVSDDATTRARQYQTADLQPFVDNGYLTAAEVAAMVAGDRMEIAGVATLAAGE